MDTTPGAAARRITNRLDDQRRIPILGVQEGDLGVVLGFPIGGLIVGSLLSPALAVPLPVLGLGIGVTVVTATPSHLTAWTWLRDVSRHYLCRPSVTLSRPAGASHEATTGGLVQRTPFTPGERTQELTSIRRAWPGTAAVEREDGSLEAFLELQPANMDFAMSGDWQAVQKAGETFANAELSFPLTLHVTTRSFPAEQLIDHLDDRLDDPALPDDGPFAELIAEYRDRRPAELADSNEIRYYLGVEVSPLDVHTETDGEPSPSETLTRLRWSACCSRRSSPVARRSEGASVARRWPTYSTIAYGPSSRSSSRTSPTGRPGD